MVPASRAKPHPDRRETRRFGLAIQPDHRGRMPPCRRRLARGSGTSDRHRGKLCDQRAQDVVRHPRQVGLHNRRDTALDHWSVLFWPAPRNCFGPRGPVYGLCLRVAHPARRFYCRISIDTRRAVRALGNACATSSSADGALPRRRSHRLSTSFATSVLSTWRNRKASTMLCSGEPRPIMSSVSAKRCSTQAHVEQNVARIEGAS
jgi:hypothetical protein